MFQKNLNNSDGMEDAILLKQLEKGSKSSFNKLYEKHWERAYLDVYKGLKDSEQRKI